MLILNGEFALGSSGKHGVLRGATNFFAVQMLWRVVLARNSAQREFLAFLIALKYACLESLARLIVSSVRCFFTLLHALVYSWWRNHGRGPPWFRPGGGAPGWCVKADRAREGVEGMGEPCVELVR